MQRKSLITKIHIGKKALNLDDDTYRFLLNRITSKTSCKDMTIPELNLVLNAMKKAGFKPNAKKYKRPTIGANETLRQNYLNKIEAMISDNKLSWEYATGICRKAVKKQRLQWCTSEELYTVIQILASHLHRQGKRVK